MPNKSFFKQLTWAFYLACSWTWCIGMFLPVILQKDFGNGAWLIFIICNVIGATAFSFVISTAEKSRRFVTQHQLACILFSAVTITFQLFFVGWVFGFLSGVEAAAVLLLMAVLFLVTKYSGSSMAAVYLWCFSLAVMAAYIVLQPGTAVSIKIVEQLTAINPLAFYALPLLALGFLLCPYLDATFHQVVQAASVEKERGNRLSFLIGFPVLFLILMVFSLLYADTAEKILLNSRELFVQQPFIINALFLYFILQAGFTALVHWQAMQKLATKNQRLGVAGAVAVAFTLAFLAPIPANELMYRLFMSFYGIIAPAYIWLVAFNKTTISKAGALSATVLALLFCAIPLLFGAYTYWYPVAVIVILAARRLLKTNSEL